MAETILLDCKKLRAACQEKGITNPGAMAEAFRLHTSLAEVIWENETVRIPTNRLNGMRHALQQSPYDFSAEREVLAALSQIESKLECLQKLSQEIERNTRGSRIIGL